MVSDNAQWIKNDNIVNNNISGVSNDNENVSANNINKKIKKIHNQKKFKNNYKNVVELKSIYEPSDEEYIETKFGDILIDEPTNIETINPIVEGYKGGGKGGGSKGGGSKGGGSKGGGKGVGSKGGGNVGGKGGSNVGGKGVGGKGVGGKGVGGKGGNVGGKKDVLNHTDEAVINKNLDEGKAVIIDEYNSIKKSAYETIPKPLIQFINIISNLYNKTSFIIGKNCVDLMDFSEIFIENIYSVSQLNDIEYIHYLLTQPFYYFIIIPFILLFFILILKQWLNMCKNNGDKMLIFPSLSDTDFFGRVNVVTSVGGGNFMDVAKDAVKNVVKDALNNPNVNNDVINNNNPNVNNDVNNNNNTDVNKLDGQIKFSYLRYSTLLVKFIIYMLIFLPVSFLKNQTVYISIIYIFLMLYFIYVYYSNANCNTNNENTVYVFEIIVCIYTILLFFDIPGFPLYWFVCETATGDTTESVKFKISGINFKIPVFKDLVSNTKEKASEILANMKVKFNPVWWFYCIILIVTFLILSYFSVIFIPIILLVELIILSNLNLSEIFSFICYFYIEMVNIFSFNIIPFILRSLNKEKSINEIFKFDILKDLIIDETREKPENGIFNKIKHFLIISLIPFTILFAIISLFLSYYPKLSDETPHSQIIIIIIYSYIVFASLFTIGRNVVTAFEFFKGGIQIGVPVPETAERLEKTYETPLPSAPPIEQSTPATPLPSAPPIEQSTPATSINGINII